MLRMILVGYLGRMGKTMLETAASDPEVQIAAGIDLRAGEDRDGRPFPTYGRIEDCADPADCIVDFSWADGVPCVVDYALARKMPLVVCTTGLSEECEAKIRTASESIPVFRSANMSLGVSLLKTLAVKAAKTLYGSGFDIEIVERHHNQKLDAPSGTAVLLEKAVNEALGGEMRPVYDRTGVRGKRSRDEIGVHAIRGGTIVGDHSVVFAGRDEVLEISHSARSKEIFAVGALRAAGFTAGKASGLFGMDDLIGEITGGC
ncbi:MAG: 4-hydroxy-tetrahydrodipicolinate reductase [Firmicutes bacterium]|nr:4-hydroxy-tetrahydrodipicolinate reductase [Bacillota bacterium]